MAGRGSRPTHYPASPKPLAPVGEVRRCCDGNPAERQRDKHPAQSAQIEDQRNDSALRFRKNLLSNLNTGRTDSCDARRAGAFQHSVLCKGLVRWA